MVVVVTESRERDCKHEETSSPYPEAPRRPEDQILHEERVQKPELHRRVVQNAGERVDTHAMIDVRTRNDLKTCLHRRPDQIWIPNASQLGRDADNFVKVIGGGEKKSAHDEEERHVKGVYEAIHSHKGAVTSQDVAGEKTALYVAVDHQQDPRALGDIGPCSARCVGGYWKWRRRSHCAASIARAGGTLLARRASSVEGLCIGACLPVVTITRVVRCRRVLQCSGHRVTDKSRMQIRV